MRRPPRQHALLVAEVRAAALGAAAKKVGIESKTWKRFIILHLQTLKSGAVNPSSTWGQPAPPYLGALLQLGGGPLAAEPARQRLMDSARLVITRFCSTRFLSSIASYDVASTVHQSL